MKEKKLSHIEKGKPAMVDISGKKITNRTATAKGLVTLGKEILRLLKKDEIHTKKGPVFESAIISGTMAVKKTSDLIPFCHPLPINSCKFNITPISEMDVEIQCHVSVEGKTGVEMEALTGASVAALTIYDMCKSLSHDIIIKEIKLMSKEGGKSSFKRE